MTNSNIIKQSETMVGVAGKDSFKVSLKKTLTQNEGFKTLEIIKNAEQGLGMKAVKTTADIFVRDSEDEMFAMLNRNNPKNFDYQSTYSMCESHRATTKVYSSLEQAMGGIQRKLQTQDYQNREHLVVIVRYAKNAFFEEQYIAYSETYYSLNLKK
jgi:hypothetical protein